MTRRVVMRSDGIFISRPGFDALDDSVARLVEPGFPMLSQHDQGTATSVFTQGNAGGGWSKHRATFNFAALPYKPMVHFGLAFFFGGPTTDFVRYPEFLQSATSAGAVVPDGKYKIETDLFWAEAHLNTYTTSAGLFRMVVTVYKHDSGLAL
ncbi:MAG: hypothetical protein GY798_08355 [Hyphomicrobiales bacterium]|nr:hypothetical protein [Hyphomicrobiales bacterium]